jgi:dolichol-phosphate mannosyltransferase
MDRSLLVEVNGYTRAQRSRVMMSSGARNCCLGCKSRLWEWSQCPEGADGWDSGNLESMGRSLDLKDTASRAQIWGDWLLLLLVQGLPLPLTILLLILMSSGQRNLAMQSLLGLNLLLLLIRIGLNFAIAPSYDLSQAKVSWLFWFSPLADPLAVLRIFLSSIQTPKSWRGRVYKG